MACGLNPCVCDSTAKDFNGHTPDESLDVFEFTVNTANSDTTNLTAETVEVGLLLALDGYMREFGKLPFDVVPDGDKFAIVPKKVPLDTWLRLSAEEAIRNLRRMF